MGTLGEVRARASRCAAKQMAQPRVRRSPVPMLEKRLTHGVPAGVVRRSRPLKARTAPRAAFQPGAWTPGGRRAGKAVKTGTKTTMRPVMKAHFAGEVRARPAVWNWYPM